VRHSWIKIELHRYICRKCGCGKVNAQDDDGVWFATFHLPTGRSVVSAHVPPCEVSGRTEAYLEKYADVIASGGIKKGKTE
jgi:hypothetical protein